MRAIGEQAAVTQVFHSGAAHFAQACKWRRVLAQADIPLCLEIHNRFLEERGIDPRQLLADLADLGFRHFTCAQRPIAAAELGGPDIIRVVARKHPGAPA